MTVVHLTSVHPRRDVRIFHKECRSLARSGHEVTLLVADGQGNECSEGVSIIDVGQSEGGRWSRMTATRDRIMGRALEQKADLYHFHDPELLPAGLALRRLGKKVIYDAHELLPASLRSKPYLPRPARWIAALVIGQYERYAAKRLSAVVAATPVIANRLRKVQSRTVVVANFPELAEVDMEPPAWEGREDIVCYQGAISWERGLREMVAAVSQANSRLLLAGAFSGEVDRKAVQRLPGWEVVEELGMLNRSELRAMMSRCSLGLVLFHPCPNHKEAQPNKLFEYMAAGLPVVAPNFPLWHTLVEGQRCGRCVDPSDTKAVANAVRWMIDNPSEASVMGQRGRKAVIRDFHWEKEESKLISLYNELSSN